MSYVHPAWLEHQCKRFERHDAHRFVKPDPVQRKSYAERMVEAQRAAEEEERAAAEQDAFEREVLQLRREWAELKLELVLRQLRLKALHPHDDDPSHQSDGDPSHHSNRQPRVPAGSPDGGQWTSEGGSGGDFSDLSLSPNSDSSDPTDPSSGNIQLAAMSWEERVKALFGQRDLFEGGGAGRGGGGSTSSGNSPWLPTFRGNGPTAGFCKAAATRISFFKRKGRARIFNAPESPGFDRLTLTHVEGHAAAYMRQEGISRSTLYINNQMCLNCSANLPSMLAPGSRLDVVMPNGVKTFVGNSR